MNIKRTILYKDENNLQYFGFSLCIFLLIFCYILLRAFFTEPLHDEVSTFYFYIYHADFLENDLYTDANNHLLNSILGFGINRYLAESFFLFRLPNVLSFPIYFFSCFGILKHLKVEWQKIIGITALSTIPFILEYFAYSRGYGIGMAFFMLALYCLLRYMKNQNNWTTSLLFFSLWIAVFANLIFINISAVIIGFLILDVIINKKNWIGFSILTFLFLTALSPFVYLVFRLKESGALYYGTLDGLWDVTGKSLSEMVFFTSGTVAFLLVSIIILLLLIGLIRLFNSHWKQNLATPLAVFSGLFFGNLILILGLAFILKVNYPEDRTGMQLIPLFILSFIFLIDALPKFKYTALLLLFFPLSFLTKISFHSSIYSPDQRMSNSFYSEIKKHMKDETTIASYHMNTWTWNWNESFSAKKHSVLLTDYPDAPVYDIILAKKNTIKNKAIFDLYDTIAVDPRTHDLGLKIKNPLKKELLSSSSSANSWVNWEYFNLFDSDSLEHVPLNQAFQITTEFDLSTYTEKQNLQLVFQSFDAEGQQLERIFYPIGLVYRNQLTNVHLKHHFVLPKFSRETKVIKVYVWNKDMTPYEVKNGKCYLYTVKK